VEGAVSTTEDLAAVIAVLGRLQLPAGALTDDEQMVLDMAGGVIDVTRYIVAGLGDEDDETVAAVGAVLAAVPGLAAKLARWLASMRSVIAKAQELEVDIGPLGAGVIVEAG
jgi:hypothetical protein